MAVPKVDEPLQVVPAQDTVIIKGKAGVAFEITPEAALISSDLMLGAALQAIGDRKRRDWVGQLQR